MDVEMNINISVYPLWEFHDTVCATADVRIRHFLLFIADE